MLALPSVQSQRCRPCSCLLKYSCYAACLRGWLHCPILALAEHCNYVNESLVRFAISSQLPVSHLIVNHASVLQAVVDDSKARKELGYKAHLSREEGLAQLRAEAAEKHTNNGN